MNYGSLSDYFTGVGFKRLSATEVDKDTSNGHEFQGVNSFKKLFGEEPCNVNATLHYLSDDISDDIVSQSGPLTWYDSRKNVANRTPEYRLYYPVQVPLVQKYARPGDLIVAAQRPNKSIELIIAKEGSSWERQLLWLFGVDESAGKQMSLALRFDEKQSLGFTQSLLIERLGIELRLDESSFLDELIRNFSSEFPSTKVFSEYARSTLPEVDPNSGIDLALMAWVEREFYLFKILEKHLVEGRLSQGFDEVEDFIQYSLSVQNRRKSRAGLGLENQLEKIFVDLGIKYSRSPTTEKKSKPDFIFPGAKEYHTERFNTENLTMLGVKTTCKDRWRQVLPEADRIDLKHLFTLESSISGDQTEEMKSLNVQLVLPKELHNTFNLDQQGWLLSLSDFTELVYEKHSASG